MSEFLNLLDLSSHFQFYIIRLIISAAESAEAVYIAEYVNRRKAVVICTKKMFPAFLFPSCGSYFSCCEILTSKSSCAFQIAELGSCI